MCGEDMERGQKEEGVCIYKEWRRNGRGEECCTKKNRAVNITVRRTPQYPRHTYVPLTPHFL